MESVQRRFTKKLRGLKSKPYPERLKCLNAETIELRRIKFDLSMYFKVLHDLVDIPRDTPLFKVRDTRTRNNGLTLYKEKFNHNMERYTFKNRCINIWNLLPQNVVCASSLCAFNRRLDSIELESIILKASICS